MHVASTHKGTGFRPCEAGLHEVALATEATVAIEAIEAIQAWGASWRSRRVQTLLVRFLLAPLEFPKLANAQPSNFGPLRIN